MLLGRNESPFPENEHCKRCASKNCRDLLVQPLFPGKVIFVHRKHFCSNPDYIPSWRNEENTAPAQEAALTDELEVVEGAIEISAPTWEHNDEENLQDYPEKALESAKIVLSTQVKNYPEGAPVTFDIYDNSESTPLLIKSIKGTNEGGTATAEWVVEDPQQKGDNLKLSIEASARSKYSQRSDVPYLAKLKCDFVEMPDVLFNHGSAVACLDSEGILLGALSALFVFAKNNSDREVVLFGHSDTSGDSSHNYDLSQWRAEGIKALIDNDVEPFLDVIDLASKVEDYQTFLSALSEFHGWNCHPGKIDTNNSEKTTNALKNFQTEYNKKFSGDLKVDGVIGMKTWAALFKVTRSLLEEIVKKECGDIPVLTYGFNGKGIYPCGESFPVDQIGVDGIKSKTNRRVEIVFFEKGKSAELKVPADKKKVEKKDAVVYDKKKAEIKPIQVNPPKPVESDTIILELVFPQVYDSSKPHKQYVNLDSNGKEQGSELTIKVKVKNIKADTAGKRVYWRVTAENTNSKRNIPKSGIMDKTGGTLVEYSEGIANLDTPFENNEASIVLACGLAGGDRFTVEAGTDGENFTTKLVVENWRKLWYEIVMPENAGNGQVSGFTVFSADKTPKLSPNTVRYMDKVMKTNFIEFEHCDGDLYQKTDLPDNGKFNIFDGGYFDTDYGKNIVAMTLKQAEDVLQKRAKHITNQRTASIIFTDYLLNCINWKKTYNNISMPTSLTTDFKVFKSAVDDFEASKRGMFTIKSLEWHITHWYDASPGVSMYKPIASESDPGWQYRVGGVITDADELKSHITFETFTTIGIEFPDTKAHYPGKIIPKNPTGEFIDNGVVLGMTLYIEGLAYSANINGAALQGTIWMNTFGGTVADRGVGGVILHELGHNMGQVYADKSVDVTFGRPAGKGIPGIPFPESVPDGLVYGGHSHQGTHCASGLSKLTRGFPSFQVAPALMEKDCLMFGASDLFDNTEFNFCGNCTTYIKDEDISDIRKSWTV